MRIPDWTPEQLAQPQELANNLALTDAARFLRQASWGGTSSEIKGLAATGQQGWLNAQFNAPQGQTLTRWLIEKGFNDASISNNLNGDGGWVQAIWWKLFSATDLFRQRAALALSELFVVSQLGLPFSWRNFAISVHVVACAGIAETFFNQPPCECLALWCIELGIKPNLRPCQSEVLDFLAGPTPRSLAQKSSSICEG